VENHLGALYKETGKYAAAERMYRRALSKVKHQYPDSLLLAVLYHNLGGLEHVRGRYVRGEALLRQAVALRERLLGPDHPTVAADLSALAALLDGQHKFAESEVLYRRAIRTFRRCRDRLELAFNYNNLATVRLLRGDTVEAARLYRRAVSIKEHLLGRDHPGLATTLNNLGLLYLRSEHRSEARRILRRASKMFDRSLGRSHPKTTSSDAVYQAVVKGKPVVAGVLSL